jgi:hypothetical protein
MKGYKLLWLNKTIVNNIVYSPGFSDIVGNSSLIIWICVHHGRGSRFLQDAT